jgi:pseudouridine synthase
MRLQTFLAAAGIASRRSAEALIRSGRVAVNGAIVRQKGYRVIPQSDTVFFDGKKVSAKAKLYYMMNKPKGVTSTVKDPYASKTVVDFAPKGAGRLYPIGRLDKDTTGLILLTNDGELAYRLTHPRFGVKKVYEATVKGALRPEELAALEKGIELEDGLTSPCRARVLSRRLERTICEIAIQEGRKRQIRRMFASLGHRVIELKRTSFAGIRLGDLKEGDVRPLAKREISSFKSL